MHADDPVELARRLVRAGHEDAEHVQPDRDHHAVRRPAVHVPHEHPERHVELEVLHVGVRVLGGRPVVEHQEDAGHDRHEEHEERDAAHAPGEAQARRVAAHLRRVQVQEDVARHHEHAVARRVVVAVAEDRLPDRRLGRPDSLSSSHLRHRLTPSGKAPGLSHCPFSKRYLTPLSTTIWPSSAFVMRTRSSGRGAGPSKLMPVL